jgi:hypothetical protein
VSIDRWYCVGCDECGISYEVTESAREARKIARDAGWRVALPGGRDLCPACSGKRVGDGAHGATATARTSHDDRQWTP